MIETIIVLVALFLVGLLLVKKVNASVALTVVGLVLLLISPITGHAGSTSFDPPNTGNVVLDQFGFAAEIFSDRVAGTGLVIMMLFGFSAYMTQIGANDATVRLLTKPLIGMKPNYKYLLVPLTFWVGTLMSLVVPSASSLAVLLMATLFPTMIAAGLSKLTAGAVIATTATIMPTPLGADNVVAAEKLGIDLNTYTWTMHARISIPVLILMGVVHYFWQRHMDRRENMLQTVQEMDRELVGAGVSGKSAADGSVTTGSAGSAPAEPASTDGGSAADEKPKAPAFYCIFPLLPLFLVLIPWIMEKAGGPTLKVSLVPVVLISLLVAIAVELVRGLITGKQSPTQSLDAAKTFFQGMGDGMKTTVGLLIGAALLVEGITKLGVIDMLINAASGMSGGTWVVIGAFVVMMLVLTLLTGGVAPFYSFVEAVPSVATGLAINGAWLTLPLQFVGNLMRACSPVAAVVLIVSSEIGVGPMKLIQRTVVPMSVGLIVSLVMTWVMI